MNSVRFLLLNIFVGLVLTSAASAQTSYPMLMSLSPVAAQTGQSGEHVLESRYSMFGASQVLVSGEGVSGEIITPMELGKDGKEPALTQIRIRFTVAEDALPGVRDFRIIGPTGPSTVGQLVVTRSPVVAEDRKNDTQDAAQRIIVPTTICGCVEKSEDVDFYQFAVEQQTTLTFQCQAMRIQDKIHDLQTHVDPLIAVRSAATGSTLVAADNSYAADPQLTFTFAPGEYLLEVRDVRYQGNKYWNYAIEISDRPFVTNVYPTVVTRGQPVRLQLIGAGLPAESCADFEAPADADDCTLDVTLPLPAGLGDSNPVPLMITELPVVVESDAENDSPEKAQPLEWPVAVTGRIQTEADIDCFAFEAKKGDRMDVEVIARRHGSGLDSIVRILNDQGKAVAESDDYRLWGKRTIQDSKIENWAVPADGRYTVEVRDVHLRGAEDFVYCIQITRAEPRFELFLDSDKTWLTPGSSAAIFVRAVRQNGFEGEIALHVDGLPEGVVAHCGRILDGKSVDGCIVLHADAAAPMTASNIRVWGSAPGMTGLSSSPDRAAVAATDGVSSDSAGDQAAAADTTSGSEQLVAFAQPMQEIYMPGGGRNHWPVAMHTVAVGAPADILDVKLSTYEVDLKPGESVTIDVELIRSSGFDKNVTLDMLFQHLSSKFADTLPPGVTIDARNSRTLLTGSNSHGAITLTAAKNAAPVEKQQCCVMANVSINFVMKATYSSLPLWITVRNAD